jgi:single-strand DNA-binding protein
MNKCILFGNVGKDPEVKTFEGGNKVAKFSLATNKSYTKNGEKITETSWHNIVLWGKLAELAEKYVKKGNSVIIEGEINYRSYENKDGQTIYITEINGDRLHFAGGKKDEAPQAKNEYQKSGKVPVKAMSDISELPGNIVDNPDFDEPPFA